MLIYYYYYYYCYYITLIIIVISINSVQDLPIVFEKGFFYGYTSIVWTVIVLQVNTTCMFYYWYILYVNLEQYNLFDKIISYWYILLIKWNFHINKRYYYSLLPMEKICILYMHCIVLYYIVLYCIGTTMHSGWSMSVA